MNTELLTIIISVGFIVIVGAISLITALVKGDMKKFVEEKMVEAEKLNMDGQAKQLYVIEAFKNKYKILEFMLNVKKLIEHIIELSKQINFKK